MRRTARSLPSPGRVLLDTGWALGCAPAGSAGDGDMRWRALPALLPVAAALAQAGEWSLAGPPRDFDDDAWLYRCRFDLPAGGASWRLGLDGLATLAEVSLNGEALLESCGMFRSYEVLLSPSQLKERGNELLIRFAPLNGMLAKRRPRPRWRVAMLLPQQQQLRWCRTTLLGRTPGWSPPAAPVGPWRPIWLEPVSAAQPTQLRLQTELVGRDGHLRVALGWSGPGPFQAHIRVERVDAPAPTVYQAPLQLGEDGLWHAHVELPQVARWWPHTHGEPALYQVSLQFASDEVSSCGLPLGLVGFRRVHVDQRDGGFQIVVNDVPVFARGACWMPLDALRLHAAPAAYGAALAPLRQAGLNLLRLSGATVYENDAFFDACDALGVMVWQDLMFANMDYPAEDAGFRAEVDEEVAQQMTRLQGRPSVVLVCGNSEVEQQAAMSGASPGLWSPALFHQHLPARVEACLPGVPYWPSSAHGGRFPFQPAAGTTSYYGLGAYRRGLDDARASGLRFATECLGFANIPGDTTLARLRDLNGGRALRVHDPLWKARSSRDLGAGCDFDDVRDHYVERLFGERADELRRHDPARHLMLGRAAVAESITAAYSQWRAADSACGGALVWFLRDLWAGAGWGLQDDLGLPKSGFHALARACQPLHLAVTDDGLNGLTLQLANERAQPQPGRLVLALYRDGETPVAQATLALSLAARERRALPLAQALGDEGFVDWNWAYRFGPPPADLLAACWLDDGGLPLAEVVHFIAADERPALRRGDLGLAGQSRLLADGSRRVTVSSRVAARGVHLEVEGWQASDAFFHLAPGGERVLHCTPVPGHERPWRAALHAINALGPVGVTEEAA